MGCARTLVCHTPHTHKRHEDDHHESSVFCDTLMDGRHAAHDPCEVASSLPSAHHKHEQTRLRSHPSMTRCFQWQKVGDHHHGLRVPHGGVQRCRTVFLAQIMGAAPATSATTRLATTVQRVGSVTESGSQPKTESHSAHVSRSRYAWARGRRACGCVGVPAATRKHEEDAGSTKKTVAAPHETSEQEDEERQKNEKAASGGTSSSRQHN